MARGGGGSVLANTANTSLQSGAELLKNFNFVQCLFSVIQYTSGLTPSHDGLHLERLLGLGPATTNI